MKNLVQYSAMALFVMVSFYLNSASVPSDLNSSDMGGAYLVFIDKFGGDVTPEQLQRNHTLSVDGCAKGSTITSYTLKITQGRKTTTYKGDSPNLPDEAVKQLKSLKKGDSFRFTSVKATLPNGHSQVDVFSKKFNVV